MIIKEATTGLRINTRSLHTNIHDHTVATSFAM